MLPINITGLLHGSLRESRRTPDGLLHASGDLQGSLRHAQLRLAGAPTIDSELVSDIRLMTGTMWHRWVGEQLVNRGVPVMQEVRVTPWMPEGWSGTADWIFWDADRRGFVLGDLKTIKGEGIKWVNRDGVKVEHLWQLSAYWHALLEAGLPLVEGFAVLYWPMNAVPSEGEIIEPTVQECDPLPRDLVYGVMEDRWTATTAYLDSLPASPADLAYNGVFDVVETFVTDALAPGTPREQKVFWAAKQGVFDVKFVPHWSTAYCPYSSELCDCREQGVTKIGHYTLDGEYVARKDYEAYEPAVAPSAKDLSKRKAEAALKGIAAEAVNVLATPNP